VHRPELIRQFNQFLRTHAVEIVALKKRFALQENRPDAALLKK
jgi:glycine cleavage system regulatory protein